MRTYSDEYLNYWGDIFTSNNIQNLMWSDVGSRFKGVDVALTFEAFLIAPEKILNEAINNRRADIPYLPDHCDFYALLPQQQLIKQRIEQDEELAKLQYFPQEKHKSYCVKIERNGHIFEPYKYHRRAV